MSNVCIGTPASTGTSTSTSPTSTATSSGKDAGSKDSGAKDSGTAKVDSGIKPDAGSSCPGTIALASLPDVQPANTAFGLGSCTPTDLSAFNTSIATAGSTPQNWYSAVSANCQKCIFSGENDATWQFIVLAPDLATGLAAGSAAEGFFSVAPCYQEAPNGSVACGKAAEQANSCIEDACPSPQCDSVSSCDTNSASAGGTCASEETQFTTACPSASTIGTYCGGTAGTIGNYVNAVCGTGTNT